MKYSYRVLVGLLFLLGLANGKTHAQERTYTNDRPLIFEDVADRWPYNFLNEKGEAVGYNVDLLNLIFDELHIPHRVVLRSQEELTADVVAGKADLTLGTAHGGLNPHMTSGRSVIWFMTFGVLHQADRTPKIDELKDLKDQWAWMYRDSRIHQMMKKHGYDDHVVVINSVEELVDKAPKDTCVNFVHNTVALKWLKRQYRLDNMKVSPLRHVQPEEIHFRSADTLLLHQMDSVFFALRSSSKLADIQHKWLAEEDADADTQFHRMLILGILLFILLVAVVGYVIYHWREHQLIKKMEKSNMRLALLLRSGEVGTMVMDVKEGRFVEFDPDGNIIGSYDEEGFLKRTASDDNEKLRAAIHELLDGKAEHVALDFRDDQDDYYHAIMGVYHRDVKGKPTQLLLIRTKYTQEMLQSEQAKEAMLRYEAIFQGALADIAIFDKEGLLTDINMTGLAYLNIDANEMSTSVQTIQQMFALDVPTDQIEESHFTQVVTSKDDDRPLRDFIQKDRVYYSTKVKPVRDEQGELEFIYATGNDVTDLVDAYHQAQLNAKQLVDATERMQERMERLIFVLDQCRIRQVEYSTSSHMFSLYKSDKQEALQLSQTRMMKSIKLKHRMEASAIIFAMDRGVNRSFSIEVETELTRRGIPFYLKVFLFPVLENGKVVDYRGIARDVSMLRDTEVHLRQESEKAQEVEGVKDAFLRNMTTEIYNPLSVVVECAENLQLPHEREDEQKYFNIIKKNTNHLLKLVNDTLYLSRLEAHMIEFHHQPVDVSALFEDSCHAAWANLKRPDVVYQIDNPYHNLVVELDHTVLDNIIKLLVKNAATFTEAGLVRARYDYTGEGLALAVMDTGPGMSPERLSHIFDRSRTNEFGHGLDLCIVHETVQQLGGHISIESFEGQGTTIWVTIPCKKGVSERRINMHTITF